MFWKRSPQSRRVIYRISAAQKGCAGCSPWEFAFGAGGLGLGCSVAPLRVGDVGSDTSVSVPGAALSQQPLAALSQRRKIYVKQKAVKGCVFIRGRREA